MNSLFATVLGLALALGAPHGMKPHVLLGDSSYCDAVMVRDGHLTVEKVCTKRNADPKDHSNRAEVTWDGHTATITGSDEKASGEWILAHSFLQRLSMKHHDLYWDGKKVDLGKVDVFELYQAIPWQGGVLIYGRTHPRRGFWESWPFKGDFIEGRDLEPYCAIFFDPKTLKGEDRWLNGKVSRPFLVFPVPD
jgi:hypothetical protein